jgi:hypothetical protein
VEAAAGRLVRGLTDMLAIPPTGVQTPRNPGVWGWDPRPNGDPGSEQNITFYMVGRGKGTEDPK